MQKLISPIISFILITILGIYVLNFREGCYLPVAIFWISLAFITFLIVYQISTIEKQISKSHILIILQILLLAFLIRLSFVSPDGVLLGYDSYNEFITFSKINTLGYWDPDKIGGEGVYYPLLYIFGLIMSKMAHITLFNTAKWLPLSIFFITPIFVYLIGTLKYSKKAGLFAMLGVSFIYISLFMHSGLQRETFAVPLMLVTIYVYFKFIQDKSNSIFLYLTMLLMSAVILAHHLTSFLLLIFFVLLFLADKIPKNSFFKLKKENISLTLVLLLFTLLFGYWIYLKYTPLEFIALIIKESAITDPGQGAAIPGTIRFKILYWSEIAFAVIFAALSFLGLLLMRGKRKTSDLALFLFSGFTGVIMIVTLMGGLIKSEGMGLGSRFETFVYFGLFILSGYTISDLLNNSKKLFRKILPVLLILFVLLSVYRVPPYLYSEYNFQPHDLRPVITEEEAVASIWLGMSRNEGIADPNLNGVLQLSGYEYSIGLGHGEFNKKNFYIIDTPFSSYLTKDYIKVNSSKIYDNGLTSIKLENSTI